MPCLSRLQPHHPAPVMAIVEAASYELCNCFSHTCLGLQGRLLVIFNFHLLINRCLLRFWIAVLFDSRFRAYKLP